jgi:PAS domain S-box-containing protein
MVDFDLEQEKARHEQELSVQRQISFASGLFQGDITIRTLLESLAEGVLIIDSSGTILLVNISAEKMFGYPREDFIGKPQAVLIPERFRKVLEDHEADYFKEPRIRPMRQLLDLAGNRRDGSEFPVEISLGFIETINGVFVLAFVSDITLRKQLETQIQDAREYAENIVETVREPLVVLNSDLRVLTANHSFYDTFKATPEDTIGTIDSGGPVLSNWRRYLVSGGGRRDANLAMPQPRTVGTNPSAKSHKTGVVVICRRGGRPRGSAPTRADFLPRSILH